MKHTHLLKTIHQIEQKCFEKPWCEGSVFAALNVSFCVLVTKTIDDVVVGFALGIKLGGFGDDNQPGECELHRIAVLPDYRNKGIGKEILADFLDKCKTDVFLEVASKNTAARKLYESAGFTEEGRRKDYYIDDDAIVYKYKFISV